MTSTPNTRKITVETLYERLEADFKLGKLYYKPTGLSWWDTRYSGQECFNINAHGYLCGTINKVRLLKHRVIFAMHEGRWPSQIDHINRNKSDNRFENLREVTQKENNQNIGKRCSNTSGKTGVYYRTREGLWLAKISNRELGYFKSKEDAIKSRIKAEQELGYVGD